MKMGIQIILLEILVLGCLVIESFATKTSSKRSTFQLESLEKLLGISKPPPQLKSSIPLNPLPNHLESPKQNQSPISYSIANGEQVSNEQFGRSTKELEEMQKFIREQVLKKQLADLKPGVFFGEMLDNLTSVVPSFSITQVKIPKYYESTGNESSQFYEAGPNEARYEKIRRMMNGAFLMKMGEKGHDGKIGPKGQIGFLGDKGEQGFRGKDANESYIENSSLFSNISFPGLEGLPGIKGIRGNKGEDGDPGLPGLRGPIGVKGKNGKNGKIGINGTRGIRGLKGEKGPKGPLGRIGHQGKDGEKGPQGEPGAKGLDGHQGSQGPIGNKGPNGAAAKLPKKENIEFIAEESLLEELEKLNDRVKSAKRTNFYTFPYHHSPDNGNYPYRLSKARPKSKSGNLQIEPNHENFDRNQFIPLDEASLTQIKKLREFDLINAPNNSEPGEEDDDYSKLDLSEFVDGESSLLSTSLYGKDELAKSLGAVIEQCDFTPSQCDPSCKLSISSLKEILSSKVNYKMKAKTPTEKDFESKLRKQAIDCGLQLKSL